MSAFKPCIYALQVSQHRDFYETSMYPIMHEHQYRDAALLSSRRVHAVYIPFWTACLLPTEEMLTCCIFNRIVTIPFVRLPFYKGRFAVDFTYRKALLTKPITHTCTR